MSDYEQLLATNAYQTCCPHLGLAQDRTVMFTGPTPAHRCYVQLRAFTPDIDHQEKYCLVDNHAHCPFYMPSTIGSSMPEFVQAATASIVPFQAPALPALTPEQQQLSSPLASARPSFRVPAWVFKAMVVALGLLLAMLIIILAPKFLALNTAEQPAKSSAQASIVINQTELSTATPSLEASATITPTPVKAALILIPTATPPDTAVQSERYATPTPEPGGQVLYLSPNTGNAGWWVSNDPQHAYLGDSYLYAGVSGGDTRISAMQFDLSSVARGAPMRQVELRLTGLRGDGLTPQSKGSWLVQLIAEKALKTLGGIDFLTMYSAPSSITLQPDLKPSDVAIDKTNSWLLDANAMQWLSQQLLDGAKTLTVRVLPSSAGTDALFAWDSGMGSETKGNAPALVISLGPPPPTPPPLPTQNVVVATLTPVPDNVMTVVAQDQTATSVALTIGTYTPEAIDVVTPTPFPENIETVQAVAQAQGQPAVLQETPTPANMAIATGNAEYATAVALTTGTFTPVPTGYVTPMLIFPSPPAENLATEAARISQATAVAHQGGPTSTPLPFNAVMAHYVYATSAPENQATAVAQNIIATAFAKVNGTPTPLPWGVVVITQVPPPPPTNVPTITPLPSLQPVTDFTPTPTATPLAVTPDHIPDYYHNKILFKTNRSGAEEVYALDVASGELYRVNEPWVYPLAQNRLGISADGKYEALVRKTSTVEKTADGGKNVTESFQIFTHSLEYDKVQQITTYQGISYDPTWSPKGDLIAFVSTNSGNDEIYTVTPDGSTLKQLTFNKFEWDKHPTWSPDGSQIAFMSNRETSRRQIWIMDADGANQRNLSSDAYEDWDPIWVP
ncbi:MAG: hypothetical protein NT075_03795 [Chloroflexi bacterium]|nr:hypothetical protein [Chloroflexota bacterium]